MVKVSRNKSIDVRQTDELILQLEKKVVNTKEILALETNHACLLD